MASNLCGDDWGCRQPSFYDSIRLRLAGSAITRRLFKRRVRSSFNRQALAVDIEVSGIKIRCHLGDNQSECDLAEGRWNNIEKIAHLTSGLAPGGTFVDIGANFGLFSLFAAREVGPSGRILAIEASPEMAARARFNATANGFDQVTVLETAVGAYEGTVDFHVTENQRGRSSAIPASGCRILTLPITTLYALTSDINRIDALKIDVEGYEDRVLCPFFEAASRALWPRRVLIEHCHARHWEQDAIAYMTAVGYEIKWKASNDSLLVLS